MITGKGLVKTSVKEHLDNLYDHFVYHSTIKEDEKRKATAYIKQIREVLKTL